MGSLPEGKYSGTATSGQIKDEDQNSSCDGDGEESEEILPDFVGHLARFDEYRRNMILTDVKFRGEPGTLTEAVELHAHKVILAVASSYFQELFQDGKSTYEIPFPTEVLDGILTFIYTGRVPTISEENLDSIMVLAHSFNLPELLSRCRLFLRTVLNFGNYKKFENALKMFPLGEDTVMQLMTSDFINFSQSPEFVQLSFEKLQEILGYKNPISGSIPTDSLLQGILTWVQAEIHNRQKHLLSLMQFVNLEEVPAEIMKRYMITLNTSYKNVGPSVKTDTMTFHCERNETPPQPDPPLIPAEVPEGPQKKKRKYRRKKLPDNETLPLSNELSNLDPNDEATQERKMSTERIANNLKAFIMKEASKEARVVLNRESLELPKKRSSTCSDKENAKKPRIISKSTEALNKSGQVDPRLRSAKNKHSAESGVDYVSGSGSGISNISIHHPLMFYVCQKEDSAQDIMVYDFMDCRRLWRRVTGNQCLHCVDLKAISKEASVLVENACWDSPRCQMAYLNRKLYIIGGKSDGNDGQGGQSHNCLDSVLYYEDFPNLTDTGHLRKIKWIGETPIYARDSLQDARSDCGVIVSGNSIYALGGRGENPSIIRSLTSCEKFSVGGAVWEKIKPMNKNRENFGLGIINNYIYAVGGWISCTSTSCALGMVERYNTELDQWQISAPLLARRCGAKVANVGSCLYAIGGSEKAEGRGKLGNIELYDPRVKHWMPIKARSAMPYTCREGAVATLNAKIISVESSTDEVNGRPLIEVFDPRARKWYTDGTLPTNGLFSSATFMNVT